jgi:hypothetical protein
MSKEKLETAKDLAKEISDLEYFIETLDAKQVIRGSGKRDISAFINIDTKKEFCILGFRLFGMGSQHSSVIVPDSVIVEIILSAKVRLENLKEKYASLWAS